LILFLQLFLFVFIIFSTFLAVLA